MPSVDLICLANSYKLDHRCVAGIRLDGGGWVRPVSDLAHGVLEYRHYRLPDRSEPGLLEVIRVGLAWPEPLPHQPENWRMDGTAWKLIAREPAAEMAPVLAGSLSRDPVLFGNTERAVPEAHFRQHPARESLVLVAPQAIRWHTEIYSAEERKRARVGFRLGPIGSEVEYDLPLTDPLCVGPLRRLEVGEHRAGEIGLPEDRKLLFTVSLGEPFGGICYKLVAAVVILPAAWGAGTLSWE